MVPRPLRQRVTRNARTLQAPARPPLPPPKKKKSVAAKVQSNTNRTPTHQLQLGFRGLRESNAATLLLKRTPRQTTQSRYGNIL
jgi:hypothetical protein